jgi:copper chaperone CopZ
MKTRILVLFIGLVVAVTGIAGDAPAVVRTTFTVEGMHCDACSAAIVSTLERIDGVLSATADHERGVAEAVYRSRQVDPEDMEAAIERLGYTVTSMRTEPARA